MKEFWVNTKRPAKGSRERPEAGSQHVASTQPKRNKYGAKKTEVDGIVFDSRREAARYVQLCLLQKAGKISGLERQVKMPVTIGGKHICNYLADFAYEENGELVIEDSKGFRNQVYKLKKKLVEALYDLTILET